VILLCQNSAKLHRRFVELLNTQGIDHRFLDPEFNYVLKAHLKASVITHSRPVKDALVLEDLLVRRGIIWVQVQDVQTIHRDLLDRLSSLDREIIAVGGM